MIISLSALAPSPGEELSWERIKLNVFQPGENENTTDDPRGDGQHAPPPDRTLLGLVTSLAAGIPVLAEVESLRFWLSQPGERSIQLYLPTADVPNQRQPDPEGRAAAGLKVRW